MTNSENDGSALFWDTVLILQLIKFLYFYNFCILETYLEFIFLDTSIINTKSSRTMMMHKTVIICEVKLQHIINKNVF